MESKEFLAAMLFTYSDAILYHKSTPKEDWCSFKELITYQSINDIVNCKAKPILTQLSEITDEDAIEVAKMVGFNKDLLNHGKELAGYIQSGKKISEFIDQLICVIDYLRSKGYDTGFRHIPSLINAGLAIKKQ